MAPIPEPAQRGRLHSPVLTCHKGSHGPDGAGLPGPKPPAEFVSAHTGDKLPIGKIPTDMVYDPKQENLYAGRGDFYQLRYGNYLIAMNMSEGRTFSLEVPGSSSNPRDLITRKALKLGSSIKIAPQQTVVIFGWK